MNNNNEFNWDFQAEHHAPTYEALPEGDYRVRIAAAEKVMSASGKPMLKITLDVSGHPQTLWHYIVFLADRPEITNRNLTSFFEGFGIPLGNFVLASYVGKCGGAHIIEDTYNEKKTNKVRYFLSPNKTAELPAWQEGTTSASLPSDDLPF